jgi:Secretion system C-terminal sorting domain
MKKLYAFLLGLSLCMATQRMAAQNDTLMFMNFQEDLSDSMATFPDAGFSDDQWVNWDEDEKEAAQSFASNWFFDLDWGSPDSIPPTDSNFVFASRSWLLDLDTISSNWLISPAIDILDDQASLHWKSAPFQGPRYLDGYSVKIMTGSQEYFTADVTTMFRAAEMASIVGDQNSVDLSNFTFSEGYMHAGSFTDTTYFVPADTAAGETTHGGLLEPHSINLADFSGQTIFVAFHHDSADDNLIEIDDLLLLGNKEPVTGTDEKIADLLFVTYPNPVDNYLNVMFRLHDAASVQLELKNIEGRTVLAKPARSGRIGEFNEQFDLRQIPAGMYTVVLTVSGEPFAKQVVKK